MDILSGGGQVAEHLARQPWGKVPALDHDGFGLFTSTPRLSWRFNSTNVKGWKQASYDVVVTRNGVDESYHFESSDSLLVPWPSSPLSSLVSFLRLQDGLYFLL